MVTRRLAILPIAACLTVLTSGCAIHNVTSPSGAQSPQDSAPVSVVTTPPAAATPPSPGTPVSASRCHTSELTASFTGLNSAMGGQRGMTLVLTNRSSLTCYVYGHVGLGFADSHGNPLPTRHTWMNEMHAQVVLHPGDSAQALVTWKISMDMPSPFHPDMVEITPPDEYSHLLVIWPGGSVLGAAVVSWPLRGA